MNISFSCFLLIFSHGVYVSRVLTRLLIVLYLQPVLLISCKTVGYTSTHRVLHFRIDYNANLFH